MYDSCCTRVSDPICEAANLACEGLKATARVVLRAAEKVVDGSRISLDAANGALIASQGVVDASRVSLDIVVLALEAASQTYRLGTEAASAIAQVSVNGLISIRNFSFDVSLSTAYGGSFAGSVRVSFLRQADVTVNINIDLRDIAAMAKQLADHVGSGLSDLF